MNVHAAFDRFMRADDFLEGRRVVEELQETLLSEEGLTYLRRQLENVEPDTPLAEILGMKAHILLDCRRMSIGYAFAWMFLELHPDPVPAEIAKVIAAAKSAEAISALAQRDPQTLAAVQHVVVATQLQNELQSELMGSAYPPGDERRVEACRVMARICDRRIDPEGAAMIAGELANAISASIDSPESIEERIGLYESVLADAPATRVDMIANAHHSLGMMHAYRIGAPNDDGQALERARHHFTEALRFRTREQAPGLWAQTQHALGRALLAAAAGDGSRARDAVGPLAGALDIYAEHSGPEAAWIDAQQALQLAYAIVAREEDSGAVERLAPAFDGQPLVLADRHEVPGFDNEEWLPPGQSLALWEELLSIERYGAAAGMPFAGWLMARRLDIAGRLTDGQLHWEILKQSDSDVVYRWRVIGDYAIDDQECLGRLLRSARDLHAVRVVARRLLSAEERATWLVRLGSLAPRPTEARAAVTSRFLSADEAQDRVKSLRPLAQQPVTDVKAFLWACLDGVSRSRTPDLYSALLILCGLHLQIARDPAVNPLTTAIATLRRAVETATPRSAVWARAVAALAKAYLHQAATEDVPDTRRARLAFQTAAEAFAELGLASDMGAAAFGLGNCDRLTAKTAADLNGVLRWYIGALERQPVADDPLGWAETTIAIGEVRTELFELTRGVAAREEAEAAYERVLAAFASNPVFCNFGTMGVEEVMVRAVAGLQRLDRSELPTPVFPPGFNERETRGSVLFLRPLTTARAMTLENRFTHPERFAVRFDPEPARLTLETALYRALAEHLSFWSIAGHADGTGASRIFVLGGEGWKDLALSQFDRADVILFVPSNSPGVRWEIETLLAKALMTKVLFLMPPPAPDYDVEGLWDGARSLLLGHAIEVPAWDSAGLFFAVNAAGQVDWTLPFETLWEHTLYAGMAERFGLTLPTKAPNA
jgi:hypothetical protein